MKHKIKTHNIIYLLKDKNRIMLNPNIFNFERNVDPDQLASACKYLLTHIPGIPQLDNNWGMVLTNQANHNWPVSCGSLDCFNTCHWERSGSVVECLTRDGGVYIYMTVISLNLIS